MEISSKYNPREVEDKWYKEWMDNGLFHSEPNPEKEAYTIVIPPPNVTGVLHMGHMLNNTIQDVLIRKARMQGFEACWVPGTDHASIATEAKVVNMLREKGITKKDLTREKFLDYAWEWKEKYGGIILDQLKKLGASCDWERTSFTMDKDYYAAVIRVFIDLHKKGYIYRGQRMINWDCEAQTALSNEEVIYKEDGENATLYSVKYRVKDAEDEWVTIATVRPETILGDSAIAVNPDDERYSHLIGKMVLVPFVNREIPVIADDYVDREFGTGCLKVTPAHDPNDFEIGERHKLEVIDTINNDGTLNAACGIEKYVGLDRFRARKEIVKDLETEGVLVDKKDFVTRIGRSERTNSVVEPKLSLQWFINMKEISKTALAAVENDEVTLVPAKFKNTYRYWMENVRDWCISRQLWWGHRIPAYYYGEGEDDYVIAESLEEAVKLASEKTGSTISEEALRQDEDVLDTWASSWLWPLQVFGGLNAENFDPETGKYIMGSSKELDYYYPTNVLVTAPEILFFWVARMIIAGYEYTGEKPFKDVYLTGIVRDKQRRKMSKSLGNSPDPLDLIDQYGADGVRTGMLFSSPAGNDLLFDEKLCEQGRNFANKIWNAFRLLKGWEVSDTDTPQGNTIASEWFANRIEIAKNEIESNFEKYRLSDALMQLYKLVWDDFCSWYLEMIKPAYGDPIDRKTLLQAEDFFESVLKLLHPFMPFISEEIWGLLKARESGDYCITAEWGKVQPNVEGTLSEEMATVQEAVTAIRNFRAQNNISPKDSLDLHVRTVNPAFYTKYSPLFQKLAGLQSLNASEQAHESGSNIVVKSDEMYLDLGENAPAVDKTELESELQYTKGFLASVDKKLGNEKFVNGAPKEVVEREIKKKEDAEARIKALKASLEALN